MDNLQAANKYADDEHLLEHGVSLIRARQSGCMHNKFIIGDKKSVGTGSFNGPRTQTPGTERIS